jgi:uncharacterized NAD-dependent epimerase/dehydratase family protein
MTENAKNIQSRRVVHLAEGNFALRSAKMSVGVIRYGIHESVAIIDSLQVGKTSQEIIGAGGDIPVVASLDDALKYDPEVLLIGITPTGGVLPPEWRPLLLKAIDHGLEVHAGLHEFLNDDEEISAAAKAKGVRLWDIRRPAKNLPVGGGLARWAKSYVSLMVGTDCALGKMTVALEIDRAIKKRGLRSEFVATGQCGIAIAGWGSPIDAIAGDFMAGAVERDVMSVDGKTDIILVEGQGSLLHPGFSSVTLGLMHGACADGLILCHQCTRTEISKIKDVPIPSLTVVAQLYLELMKGIKPTEIVGVALNTVGLSDDEAKAAVDAASAELNVPATDCVRFGAEPLVDALEAHRAKIGK